MAFRTVTIGSEAEIHARAGQLVVLRERPVSIPIEDIAVLVLESLDVLITSSALSALTEAGAVVLTCDSKHTPNGALYSFGGHSRLFQLLKQQLATTLPLKKRLWQRLIIRKIENQALCLSALGVDGATKLLTYAARVQSGDTTGVEAVAARYYFARLMPGIRRHGGAPSDGALDYGYAVVRAAVARSLVAHGLNPALGLQHCSELNAFNLADDLIEPFRPLVDLRAIQTGADVDSVEGRQILVGALNADCMVDKQCFSILTATDNVVVSLVSALRGKDARMLRTPVLVSSGQSAGALTE